MIAAFSSPLLPSVRFAQPRLEEQPYRAARQNEHQRQTGNAHVLHAGRPSYSARIITNIFYTGMDNSNTKREREPERDNGAGITSTWKSKSHRALR